MSVSVRYIIQARTASSRLPDKIIQQIGPDPLILHIIHRILLSGAERSEILFAIPPEDRSDFTDILESSNLRFVYGDPHDVLKRYIDASADLNDEDVVVRLTGDNPYPDHSILKDCVLEMKNHSEIDFLYPHHLPLGMAFELIRVRALRAQLSFPLAGHHREHVTMFIKEHPDDFLIKTLEYNFKEIPVRLTVDYPEDLEMARKLYNYFNAKPFLSSDIISLYDLTPDFFNINQNMKQKKATEHDIPS